MDRTCRSVFERTDMQTIELDREDAPVYTCEVKKVDTEVVNEAKVEPTKDETKTDQIWQPLRFIFPYQSSEVTFL